MRAHIATAVAVLAASAAAPAAAQYYGDGYGYDGQVIRCESNDGRTRECSTNGGRVVLERQHSRTACIEGRTWGYGRNGIWVSQGCRADFRVVGYGGGYDDGPYGNQGNGYGYGSTAITGGDLRHEVDGTTDEARWFPVDEALDLPHVPIVDAGLALAGLGPAYDG